MVSHEQAIRRLKLLECAAQGGVGCRFADMHEVAGDEDQRGVAVVCVDVGNRRLNAHPDRCRRAIDREASGGDRGGGRSWSPCMA